MFANELIIPSPDNFVYIRPKKLNMLLRQHSRGRTDLSSWVSVEGLHDCLFNSPSETLKYFEIVCRAFEILDFLCKTVRCVTFRTGFDFFSKATFCFSFCLETSRFFLALEVGISVGLSNPNQSVCFSLFVIKCKCLQPKFFLCSKPRRNEPPKFEVTATAT